MAEEKKIKVLVMRDYWDEALTRIPAGTEAEVSIDAAMTGIETGALKRLTKKAE